MEAIILAGGFGTRLRHVVSDVPKPMAPMDDKGTPFLCVILNMLKKNGFNRVILSTGYMSEKVEAYFGNDYKDIKIDYSVEYEPLFTGGAVKKALELCNDKNVFVLNGDTYFDVDFQAMLKQHIECKSDFTIAVKLMEKFDRYGSIVFNTAMKIESFKEKCYHDIGWINGGIYCVNKNLLKDFPENKFSLEQDFMEKKIEDIELYAFKSEGYFIDIGVPEDYFKAKLIFEKEVQN